jgi:hypothetical protein
LTIRAEKFEKNQGAGDRKIEKAKSIQQKKGGIAAAQPLEGGEKEILL